MERSGRRGGFEEAFGSGLGTLCSTGERRERLARLGEQNGRVSTFVGGHGRDTGERKCSEDRAARGDATT